MVDRFPAIKAAPLDHDAACCTHAHVEVADNAERSPAKPSGDNLLPSTAAEDTRSVFLVEEMDCAAEIALIQNKLSSLPAVSDMDFDIMQRRVTVRHAPGQQESISQAIHSLGMSAAIIDPDSTSKDEPPPKRRRAWPLALAGVAAVGSEILSFAALSASMSNWLPAWLPQFRPAWLPSWGLLTSLPSAIAATLALIAVIVGGLGTYKKGWIALRHGNLNINALMSIAVTGALMLGQWPEAAMVMVLFSLAELIESKSLDRARNAVGKLLQLSPDRVTQQQADGTWSDVDSRQVGIGAIVRVKPGERIGLDGVVTSGRSAVNQAAISGESLPVDKTPGDAVFAGTLNASGSLDYRVTARADGTLLARIIHAVSAAQASKAPTQRFVDQFARIYTPVIFALALLVAIVPPMLFSGAWQTWIYKALVLLVIACPCALVISTPVTIASGLASAARKGILIKGGVYLEMGRTLTALAFDKTGTITRGVPVQTDVHIMSGADAQFCGLLAASLAGRSDHPVSKAVAQAANIEELNRVKVEAFEALPGRGVQGVLDGRSYALGNRRLVAERGFLSVDTAARLDVLESEGKTAVMLMDEKGVLALFAVADEIREGSRDAIAALRKLDVRTVMLSGDNERAVAAIAREVGIDKAYGNQLPEDKLGAIAALAENGARVGMVGDGINDAPALARADIGFAMGVMGSDAAIETADVALMDDDLRKVGVFIGLSKATHSILVQNITLALGIKAAFLIMALAGSSTLWMAVVADVGASLLVIGNGLRLLRK
ncbi:heavy metal translocating P-type ATPase [Caballeronia udeis]|uniref:P-type Zn(2+) transporter n=1 Tax=Caballeronia udeis TaxID=1232866 RepID=A0A158FRJ3_9BURK|nr:heavy metal translocating P-type ATPase [Caballeronia udeis]